MSSYLRPHLTSTAVSTGDGCCKKCLQLLLGEFATTEEQELVRQPFRRMSSKGRKKSIR